MVQGSTGATGREVVKTLLERKWDVLAVSRRPLQFSVEEGVNEEGLTRLVSDLSDANELISAWKGRDALFNCLGTTRGDAGSAEAFVEVEVGLTQKASEAAKLAGIIHAAVVSAQGANKNTWVPSTYIHPLLYMRTLGEKEDRSIAQQFPSLTLFQVLFFVNVISVGM
jgi:oxidoreductase